MCVCPDNGWSVYLFLQAFRQSLFSSWMNHLGQANIAYRQDLARVEVCVVWRGRVCGVGVCSKLIYFPLSVFVEC